MTKRTTEKLPGDEEISSSTISIPKTSSANNELANILKNSLENKISTKRVWNQPSKDNDSNETLLKNDEESKEKVTSKNKTDFESGNEDELIDFLSDFRKNCQQRRRTVRRRPKLQK